MDAALATSPETVTTRPPRAAVLRIASACEWRLVRGDPGWWAMIALISACVAYAAFNGRTRVAERRRAVAGAVEDESRRLDSLVKSVGGIERGEVPPPTAPYLDPRNAIFVGRGQGAAVAFLPDAPLAAAAVGLSDLYPQVFKVSAGGKDTFLFADDIENPSLLLAGGFDLAFAIVYVLPLFILAAGYDVLSGERERGTLALTASTSAPLPTLLAGKLLVRVGGVTLAALLTTWALLGARSSGGLAAMAGLTLAILLYAAFWAAVCLFVNAWGRDSAFNAVALVAAWTMLLVIGPAAVNAAAQVLYPAPARSELVLAVREAAVDVERDRNAADARYREEHRTGPNAGADDLTRRTVDVTVAADARADAMLAEQESLILRQRRLAERLAYLLPPCLVHDVVAELAGNGHTRWDDYLERVATFHARWREFFVTKARAGEPLTVADYEHLPRFDATPDESGSARSSIARVGCSLGMVAAVAATLALASVRRLSRPS
jgi:ABC-2 type transport system permease protein